MSSRMRVAAALVLCLAAAVPAAAFEICSWNTKHLGWANGRDWVLSARVIEGCEFAALQEVMDPQSVGRLEGELESLTGERWASVVSGTAVGRSSYREHYAFMWQEDAVRYAGAAASYLDPGDIFEREPFAARFESVDGRWRWAAATVHLVYGDSRVEREVEARALDEYVAWVESSLAEGAPVVLMGDFNLRPGNEAFGALRSEYRPMIIDGATTLSTHEGRYANLYDQVFLRPGSLPVRGAWIDRFPERLGITHARARDAVSDHAAVVVSLTREAQPRSDRAALPGPEAKDAGVANGERVRIACAHPDAAGADRDNLTDEYIVLANPGARPVSLARWVLEDAAGHRIELAGVLPPGASGRVDARAAGRPVWNNAGDMVILRGPSGAVETQGSYPGAIPMCP